MYLYLLIFALDLLYKFIMNKYFIVEVIVFVLFIKVWYSVWSYRVWRVDDPGVELDLGILWEK